MIAMAKKSFVTGLWKKLDIFYVFLLFPIKNTCHVKNHITLITIDVKKQSYF